MSITQRFNNPASWMAALFCLLTIAVYWPGLAGDYMFDDRPNLLENRRLDMASLDMDSLTGAAWSSTSGALRRPVSMASFALNRYFFGIDPWSYKVVNLGIHLLTGLGLWLLGGLIVRAYVRHRNPDFSATAVRWLPVVVAGLWLVHPLNLTTVLYIVQRMTGLSALFSVAGLCLYLIGRLRMREGRPGLFYILAGLFVFGVLAVLSKESGILLPVFMLVLEISLFRFRDHNEQIDRRIAGFFLLFLALPALLTLLVMLFEPGKLFSYSSRIFTPLERLMTEARVLMFYLKMIVMPSINELGLYHDDIALSRGLLDPPATLLSVLAIAGLLVTAVALPARQALVSLGILWFFAGHLLESTIIPLELAHEHRNYLADFGILLAAGAFVSQLKMHHRGRLIRIGSAALFLLMFSYTTWIRAGQWADNVQHAIYEAIHHPESMRAVFAAGRIHARLALNGVTESEAEAFDYLERARQLDRTGIMPDATLIILRYHLGRPVDPASFTEIRRKLIEYPLSTSDMSSLKMLTECYGNGCDIPTEVMDELLTLGLDNTKTPQLLTIYGFFRINKLGDFDSGLELFREVVERYPGESQHWVNLINLLIVMERYEDAERQLELLRTSNSYGGNAALYDMLENEINTARRVNTALTDQGVAQETLQ
ncbi:MAG: tetratricopeptide repeat protein [Gammaproteobacteria bacterium]